MLNAECASRGIQKTYLTASSEIIKYCRKHRISHLSVTASPENEKPLIEIINAKRAVPEGTALFLKLC